MELPAQALLRALGSPAIVVAGGQLAVRAPRLASHERRIEGDLGVRWSGATLSLSGLAQSSVLALGEVRFDATGQADAPMDSVDRRDYARPMRAGEPVAAQVSEAAPFGSRTPEPCGSGTAVR
jgi:hypothetical protein